MANEEFEEIILKPRRFGTNTPIQNIEAFYRKKVKTYQDFKKSGKSIFVFLDAGDLIDTEFVKELVTTEPKVYDRKGIIQLGEPIDRMNDCMSYITISISKQVYHPVMYLGVLEDANIQKHQCDECGEFWDKCPHYINFYPTKQNESGRNIKRGTR